MLPSLNDSDPSDPIRPYTPTIGDRLSAKHNPVSAAHLQDENNFFQDLKNERLPAVSFIKPPGPTVVL